MRRALTAGMIIVGVTLMLVSYFALAAPWGVESVANSNPRVPFAPGFFVLGIMLVFGSALAYELLPDHDESETSE